LIIIDLVNNLALLVALSVLSGFIGKRCRHQWHENVLQGLLFGGAAVIGMLRPVFLDPGVFFDGRSVMISLCGLFFGPLSVMIAGAMAVACRLWQGGNGQLMGLLVIVSSGALGLIFYNRQSRKDVDISTGLLWCVGALVHAAMILLMFCLPCDLALVALKRIALPVVFIYPLATVLIGKVLSDQRARVRFLRALQDSRDEFRTTLYSIGDGILTTDNEGHVCQLNPEAERLLGWTEGEARGRRHDEVFKTVDEKTRVAVESPIERVLNEGNTVALADGVLLCARDRSSCPIADSCAPIRNQEGDVTGVVLVFRDQSDDRQVQRVLQAERDNLRAVMTASPVAIMVLDSAVQVVDANPAAERLFCREQAELGDRSCGEFLGCVNRRKSPDGCGHAADCAACILRNVAKDVFATGQGVYDRDMEYTLDHHGGQQSYSVRFSVELVELNGCRHVMVAMMDTTDHKRTEKELRESEQRYRILADSGQGLIWTSKLDKTVDYFNQPWLAFTGKTLEQELGTGWVESVHSDDRELALRTYEEAFDRRERFNMVYRLRRYDGAYRWVQDSGSPRYDTQGSFLGYIGHCLDITESRQTEENLRRIEWMLAKKPKKSVQELPRDLSGREALTALNRQGPVMKAVGRETLASIVDEYLDLLGTCSMIFEASGDYAFGLFDSRWCKLLDRSTRKMCDTEDNAKAVLSGDWLCHESCWSDCAKQVIAKRVAVDVECHGGIRLYAVPIMVHENVIGVITFGYGDPPRDPERLRALSETCRVSYDELSREADAYDSRPPFIIEMAKGRLQASAWLIGSLVEARQSEEARAKIEAQFRQAQKMEAVGRLAGGVAHDFNNILQAIIGYGELLLDKLPEQGETREFAGEIVGESKRAAALTRQLLTFARRQAIDPKVFDLNESVTLTLKMLRRLLDEDIELVWKPDKERCLVKMDVGQFDQILANLAVNARDAIEGVGQMVIETGREVFDELRCSLNPGYVPGRYVTVTVTDNGCGMDSATLERLFEPFFTTKERSKGTGLGLATVYGIVKQSQGYITVHSAPGKGSVFKIYLPEQASSEVTFEELPKRETAPLGHETVLIVDDEESLLRAGRRMLEGLGYTVLAAASPEEALRLVGTYPHDIHVLLTDVVMPGMSGRDLWRKVEPLRPATKCIYMSGFTANIIAQRSVLDKSVNFLQKPFSKAALGNKLREVLSTGAAERS